MKLPFITKKRKLQEECWSLDYNIVKWLNEHLKVYLKDAYEVIDLEYDKFEYKGNTYTMLQMINRFIVMTDELLDIYSDMQESDIDRMYKLKDEMYDILKIIHFRLWY